MNSKLIILVLALTSGSILALPANTAESPAEKTASPEIKAQYAKLYEAINKLGADGAEILYRILRVYNHDGKHQYVDSNLLQRFDAGEFNMNIGHAFEVGVTLGLQTVDQFKNALIKMYPEIQF